jgi:proline iminopeptidase
VDDVRRLVGQRPVAGLRADPPRSGVRAGRTRDLPAAAVRGVLVYQEGASLLFPDLWEHYLAPIPEDDRDDLIAAYGPRLNSADADIRIPAAAAWARWEASTINLHPSPENIAHFADPETAVAFARIENHYFLNEGFLEEEQLLRDIDRIRHIPGVIVQGRYDVCTPAATAWDLHKAWPEADLHIVADAGHSYDEPGILHRLIEATDRFAASR